MIMEKWKDVKGFEGFYQVSNLGRIKSFCRKKPIILKPKIKENGYLEVCLFGKSQYVHRLVVVAFISEIKKGLNVNHKDGIKGNNNLNNLEIVTISENLLHAFRNGLRTPYKTKGTKNGNSKLTEIDVLQIRKTFKKGKSVEFAKRFKVDPSTILSVFKRSTWKHI